MNGYIYKITNDLNDKVYIGLATTSIQERFATHKKDRLKRTHEHRPLYAAMNKYGVEHFSIELVEECDLDFLAEREQYWIAFYDSYTNGYNATLGGDGTPKYDHKAILARLQECPYPVLIAQEFGCCKDIVYNIAKRNNIEVKNCSSENFAKKKKTIAAFDKKTNLFIKEFESTVKAAEWCYENKYSATISSGVRAHISDCANGKRKSAYGFVWKYQ